MPRTLNKINILKVDIEVVLLMLCILYCSDVSFNIITTITNNSSFPSLIILMVLLEPQIHVFTTVFLKVSFTLEPLQKSHAGGPLPKNCLTFSTRTVQLVVSFKVGVIVNVPITSGKKKPRFGNT